MELKEKIINIQSGKISWRDYTAEEIIEVEKALAEAEIKAEAQAEIELKRKSALSKLAALGLQEDDLKALGL